MATERIPFRLIICQHCNHNLCWVNHRFPTYCPACGKTVYPEVRGQVRIHDPNATLKYNAELVV